MWVAVYKFVSVYIKQHKVIRQFTKQYMTSCSGYHTLNPLTFVKYPLFVKFLFTCSDPLSQYSKLFQTVITDKTKQFHWLRPKVKVYSPEVGHNYLWWAFGETLAYFHCLILSGELSANDQNYGKHLVNFHFLFAASSPVAANSCE